MKKYHVAAGDGKGYYGVGYESYFEATELLKISQRHDPQAHIVEEEYYFTNADRIRAMSDEELCRFLCEVRSGSLGSCGGCMAGAYCYSGHNGWIDWLKAPVEGGAENEANV